MHRHIAAAVLATGALAAVPASAQLITFATRVGNYTNTATTWVTVPLTNYASFLNFTTTAPNQNVRFTYNAECGALGTPGGWMAVQILVDGQPTNPNSGTSFALCTATSTTTFSWTGAVRQSVLAVPHSGSHTLTVQALGEGVNKWWLGDSSIVIDK